MIRIPFTAFGVAQRAVGLSNPIRYSSPLLRLATCSTKPLSTLQYVNAIHAPSVTPPIRLFSSSSTPSSTPITGTGTATATDAVPSTPLTLTAAAAGTNPNTSKKETIIERFKKYVEKNQLKWINFSIAGVITFGAYTVYSFGFDLIDFYLEHRELDAPYLAFFTGIGCTAISLGWYRLTRRFFVLKSGRMYREVLRTVFKNDIVRMRLGEDVKTRTLMRMQRYGRETIGQTTVAPNFRYVSFLPARLRYRKEKDGWAKYWQPRRLQVTVWVEGSQGGGLVTAEVEQMLRGEYDDINVCVVDLLDKGEQLLVRPSTVIGKRKNDLNSLEEEKTGLSQERDLLSKTVNKY